MALVLVYGRLGPKTAAKSVQNVICSPRTGMSRIRPGSRCPSTVMGAQMAVVMGRAVGVRKNVTAFSKTQHSRTLAERLLSKYLGCARDEFGWHWCREAWFARIFLDEPHRPEDALSVVHLSGCRTPYQRSPAPSLARSGSLFGGWYLVRLVWDRGPDMSGRPEPPAAGAWSRLRSGVHPSLLPSGILSVNQTLVCLMTGRGWGWSLVPALGAAMGGPLLIIQSSFSPWGLALTHGGGVGGGGVGLAVPQAYPPSTFSAWVLPVASACLSPITTIACT